MFGGAITPSVARRFSLACEERINLPQYAWLHSLAVSDSHFDMRLDGSGFHIAHPGVFVAGPQL